MVMMQPELFFYTAFALSVALILVHTSNNGLGRVAAK